MTNRLRLSRRYRGAGMQKLREQHRQIEALAGRLRALTAESHPAGNSDLVQVRLALSVLLRDHLALEEELIYAPLRRHRTTYPI